MPGPTNISFLIETLRYLLKLSRKEVAHASKVPLAKLKALESTEGPLDPDDPDLAAVVTFLSTKASELLLATSEIRGELINKFYTNSDKQPPDAVK